jgi:hypothetical protein
MDRLTWSDLPPAACTAVQEHTGPLLEVAEVSTGANSAIAVKACTASGEVFIKGIPVDNRQVKTQRREAAVNPHLPKSAPRLLWHLQAGGWDLLGFEVVDGQVADFSPDSPDLPLVVDALTELAATPCPDIELLSFAQRYAAYSDTPDLFTGDTLLHTDMAPHNVLIDHTAHLIDWAWPSRGPAWADPAVWAVRLIEAGHSPAQAERWASKLPAFSDADPETLLAFAQANDHHWQEVRAQAPDSAWKQQMAASSTAWLDHRRRLPAR